MSGDEASTTTGISTVLASEGANSARIVSTPMIDMVGPGPSGELEGSGSLTLMVTLLGVPEAEARTVASSSRFDAFK